MGTIVLLYLLFPMLTWAYRKNRIALFVVLCLGYGLQYVWPDSWNWEISALPVTLMLKSVLGFLLMDFLPRQRCPAVKKAVAKLAPMAYCVFLLQHICINWMRIVFVKVVGVPYTEFSPMLCLGLLAVTFAILLVASYLLKIVSDRAVKFAESKFLS